jgi:putrescine aminotransferase
MNKELWFGLDDIEGLAAEKIISLSRDYVNPGMVKMFGMLGFDRIKVKYAEGMYIFLDNDRQILDMTGGNCVLGHGHNHPRILRARNKMAQEKRLEICKSFLSPYVAALAANMASLLPGDLQYSFFCGSGAEAVEGALKLAQKHHGLDRIGIVYTDHSFHGKTHAAMSVSSMDESRKHFQSLPQCYQVPYGDPVALEAFLRARCSAGSKKPDICAFILEAIHGTRLIFPPEGYLKKVRQICDEYDILLILDEIYTGFGRTGYWFAFEAEEIIPDIVCYSKAFGGGKASIAGFTSRKDVFLKAYGNPEDSMMHSSTFSGMSEECASAIEAVNIIKDEHLVEQAREKGMYLKEKLYKIKEKYSGTVIDVRGRGLLWGVELSPPLNQLIPLIEQVLPNKSGLLSQLAGAIVLTELFHTHDILAYLGFTRRNLVVLSPSLFVSQEELDRVVQSLDEVLCLGWLKLGQRFVSRMLASKLGSKT